MNRRQKIIVSVVGIFIVLLALVGITYGYFLTRIQGNTNTTSITVTTADLKLVYGDGNGVLTPAELLMPGKDIKFLDANGKTVESKTFTVTNEGNDTDYVVIFEDVSVTYASNGTTINGNSYNAGDTTTFESNDFRYTLTCVERDKDGNETECNGIKYDSFPMNGGVVVGNNIGADVVHTYTLTMKYLETGKDQSLDMNKTISAKINIEDIRRINPYKENTNSLAYNIINNSIIGKNGTELVSTPLTKVAEEQSLTFYNYEETNNEYTKTIEQLNATTTSLTYKFSNNPDLACKSKSSTDFKNMVGKYCCMEGTNVKKLLYFESYDVTSDSIMFRELTEGDISSYEMVLSQTNDDYGTSYFYRGNVVDNYVDFAGMCWRIVRIAGDGSIKLILEDQDNTCATSNGNWDIGYGEFGYNEINFGTYSSNIMNYLNPNESIKETSMASILQKFQVTKLSGYLDKLKNGDWCFNDNAYEVNNNTISVFDFTDTIPLLNNEILDKYNSLTDFYYDSLIRLSGENGNYYPTLKCNGIKFNSFFDNTEMFVGGLTADEVAFSGATTTNKNIDYYLLNDYQEKNNLYFWLLSPGEFRGHSRVFVVDYNGYLNAGAIMGSSFHISIRPTVQIKSSVEISKGDGTKDNAYEIKVN